VGTSGFVLGQPEAGNIMQIFSFSHDDDSSQEKDGRLRYRRRRRRSAVPNGRPKRRRCPDLDLVTSRCVAGCDWWRRRAGRGGAGKGLLSGTASSASSARRLPASRPSSLQSSSSPVQVVFAASARPLGR